MPGNTDKREEAFQYILRRLEEAVTAGATAVELKREEQGLMVVHCFKSTGRAEAPVPPDMEETVIEEYWVNVSDLELAPIEPLNREQPTAIITDALSVDSQVDPTLFTLDRSIRCDCGANVDLPVGHQQSSENDRQVSQDATMYRTAEQRREEEITLLAAIKAALPKLESLGKQANSHWGYEDPVYRFYHGSFKVYQLQGQTAEIVTALQDLAPHIPLHPWFTQIVANGAAEQFSMEVNQRWPQATRPILEAFFHARFFLEMVCKYGRELNEPPDSLPSGWAAVLHLYDLR